MADPRVVVDWYARHARALPWREPGTSAYGVLVSEVMSQQTPVARVEPAWREWMRRWPDPTALAGSAVADVLMVWGRLGYPRRALRLREAAIAMVERFGGEVPSTRADLESLPGVGSYTAGAVLAFAYGQRALALDTNVRRVLARVDAGLAAPPPSLTVAERRRAETLLPGGAQCGETAGSRPAGQEAGGSAGDAAGSADAAAGGSHVGARDAVDPATWMVAVMELGALVCTARTPSCDRCPWAGECAWRRAGYPPDEHAGRRRSQAWAGTDRQARGRVMAVLRQAGPGTQVDEQVLWRAAAQAGGDDDQPRRALAGLVADGLVAREGTSYRLP